MMATAKQALAAARRKWGKRAFVRENKNALTPAQRQERRSHVTAVGDQIKASQQERDALGHDWQALLRAAEFFLDVNGDEPSGAEFRAAVSAARRFIDLNDEIRSLKSEHERLRVGLHNRRWDAGYVGQIPGLGDYLSCDESADTLDELLAKITGHSKQSEATTDAVT